jgi:hypothetical protein
MTKYCPTCRRVLPRTAFARCRRRWDGCQSRCRACTNVAQRQAYARRHGYEWLAQERRMHRPWPPAARG